MKVCILLFAASLAGNCAIEPLNQWLAVQIRADEQILSNALSQVDGYSLDLLKDSTSYVPFFLELPKIVDLSATGRDGLFSSWIASNEAGFLPGGYVYRLNFNTAPTLYATSAGDWTGNVWRCLTLGRNIVVEPTSVWGSLKGDYLYATLLTGVTPRLVVYNQRGEIDRQESFDTSVADWEQRFEIKAGTFSGNAKPALEMISLAEYLKNPNAPWRALDISGQFNMRNQQQRPDELVQLKLAEQLTRSVALAALQSGEITLPLNPTPTVPQPETRIAPEIKPTLPTRPEAPTSSTSWLVATTVIAAALGLMWLLLKGRK